MAELRRCAVRAGALLMAALLVTGCKTKVGGATCDGDLPTLGTAGGFGADTFPLEWTQDTRTGLWLSQGVAVNVADDTVGLGVTVDAGSARVGVGKLVLDGRVVMDAIGGKAFGRKARTAQVTVDTAATGDTAGGGTTTPGWGVEPFFHYPSLAGAMVLPMNTATRPTPGCMLVQAAAVEQPGEGALHLTTKRSPVAQHTLDIDVVVVDGAGISEPELATAVGVMKSLYAGGGALEVGQVKTWSVSLPGGAFIGSSNAELAGLRATDLPGSDPWSMRFYVIADFAGEAGTLGIAAGIPGALGVPGTAGSGVVVAVDGHRIAAGVLDVQTLGETMAHEAGHLMGLFHTTEGDGTSFDVIDDTPECDAATFDADGDGYLDAEECPDADGANFMFWVSASFRQTDVSPGQADVLNRSPVSVRDQE